MNHQQQLSNIQGKGQLSNACGHHIGWLISEEDCDRSNEYLVPFYDRVVHRICIRCHTDLGPIYPGESWGVKIKVIAPRAVISKMKINGEIPVEVRQYIGYCPDWEEVSKLEQWLQWLSDLWLRVQDFRLKECAKQWLRKMTS